jgi:hypothetical protein
MIVVMKVMMMMHGDGNDDGDDRDGGYEDDDDNGDDCDFNGHGNSDNDYDNCVAVDDIDSLIASLNTFIYCFYLVSKVRLDHEKSPSWQMYHSMHLQLRIHRNPCDFLSTPIYPAPLCHI